MSKSGKSSSSLVIRLAVLVILGLAAAAAIKFYGSPAVITPAEVQQMLDQNELVGLPLPDAARRLQHTAPPSQDCVVVFDFAHIRGWTAGPIALDVRDGRVFSAAWQKDTNTRE